MGANMNKEDCKKVFVEQCKTYQRLRIEEEPNVYERDVNFGVYLGMREKSKVLSSW